MALWAWFVLGLARPATGQTIAPGKPATPCLRTSQLLEFGKSIAPEKALDTFPAVANLAFGNAPANILAFEENRTFIYAMGNLLDAGGDSKAPRASAPRGVRRLVALGDSLFVVDDQPTLQISGEACFESERRPQINGQVARIAEGTGELVIKALVPKNAAFQIKPLMGEGSNSHGWRLEIAAQARAHVTRFLSVVSLRDGNYRNSIVRSELTGQAGRWKLTIASTNQVFHLALPPPNTGAGEIAISNVDGRALVENRPFPSGVLPHGPEGTQLLEEWDSDYRHTRPPLWDIGRPADELQKAVKSGVIHSCRIVDLCCGSGTDAIYLAERGFDVTGIDVAPTALIEAQQKARRAGVHVRWLLADVLAAPTLEPFDAIYDRGCYHVVRDQNLAAYLETIRRLSHPGTQFLLLAARHDEQKSGEGPTGVTEEELRFDFLPLFDLEKIQEIRLESNQPGLGPPGWSVLLRRKTDP